MRLAELQAQKLLIMADVDEPPVSETVITSLPRVRVERVKGLKYSGSSQWRHGRWLIQINAREALVRQRWTLAHELKH